MNEQTVTNGLRAFGELAAPKIQEITSQLATATLDQAQIFGKKIVRQVGQVANKRPVLLYGFAGLVLAGVAIHYVRRSRNEVVAKATP